MASGMKKRFWSDVMVSPSDKGWQVLLDQKQIKTPAGKVLAVPTQAAADLVAREWASGDQPLVPNQMPATRWANSAIDKVTPHHGAVADMLAEYGASDLLCYRSDTPNELVARETAAWDAPLAWSEKELDAPLRVTIGMMPIEQPNHSLTKLHQEVRNFAPFALAAMHDLVVISGSLILALAVAKREMTAQEAWTVSRVGEIWQAEVWGEDEEAEAMARTKCQEMQNAEIFLNSLT